MTASSTTTTPPSDVIIKTKIENATEGLSSDCFNLLHNRMLQNLMEVAWYGLTESSTFMQ
jgi:hypothetical protein